MFTYKSLKNKENAHPLSAMNFKNINTNLLCSLFFDRIRFKSMISSKNAPRCSTHFATADTKLDKFCKQPQSKRQQQESLPSTQKHCKIKLTYSYITCSNHSSPHTHNKPTYSSTTLVGSYLTNCVTR